MNEIPKIIDYVQLRKSSNECIKTRRGFAVVPWVANRWALIYEVGSGKLRSRQLIDIFRSEQEAEVSFRERYHAGNEN